MPTTFKQFKKVVKKIYESAVISEEDLFSLADCDPSFYKMPIFASKMNLWQLSCYQNWPSVLMVLINSQLKNSSTTNNESDGEAEYKDVEASESVSLTIPLLASSSSSPSFTPYDLAKQAKFEYLCFLFDMTGGKEITYLDEDELRLYQRALSTALTWKQSEVFKYLLNRLESLPQWNQEYLLPFLKELLVTEGISNPFSDEAKLLEASILRIQPSAPSTPPELLETEVGFFYREDDLLSNGRWLKFSSRIVKLPRDIELGFTRECFSYLLPFDDNYPTQRHAYLRFIAQTIATNGRAYLLPFLLCNTISTSNSEVILERLAQTAPSPAILLRALFRSLAFSMALRDIDNTLSLFNKKLAAIGFTVSSAATVLKRSPYADLAKFFEELSSIPKSTKAIALRSVAPYLDFTSQAMLAATNKAIRSNTFITCEHLQKHREIFLSSSWAALERARAMYPEREGARQRTWARERRPRLSAWARESHAAKCKLFMVILAIPLAALALALEFTECPIFQDEDCKLAPSGWRETTLPLMLSMSLFFCAGYCLKEFVKFSCETNGFSEIPNSSLGINSRLSNPTLIMLRQLSLLNGKTWDWISDDGNVRSKLNELREILLPASRQGSITDYDNFVMQEKETAPGIRADEMQRAMTAVAGPQIYVSSTGEEFKGTVSSSHSSSQRMQRMMTTTNQSDSNPSVTVVVETGDTGAGVPKPVTHLSASLWEGYSTANDTAENEELSLPLVDLTTTNSHS